MEKQTSNVYHHTTLPIRKETVEQQGVGNEKETPKNSRYSIFNFN